MSQQQQSQFDEKWPQERSYAPPYYPEGQEAQREANRDSREQPQGAPEYSYAPMGPQGYGAFYGQGEKLTPRPPRRTHRGRNWLIGIIIVLALIGGASSAVKSFHGPMNMQMSAKPQMMSSSTYIGTGSSLVFHGIKGHVTIHAEDTNQVLVKASGNISFQGSSDNGVITLQQTTPGKPNFGPKDNDGGTIDITVPKNMDLSINMVLGPVEIDGVTGKLNIQAADGEITINHTTLRDGSKLQTANGPIRFNGSLDPNGSYDFETVNGDVEVRLPKDEAAAVSTNTMHGDVNNHRGSTSNAANAANVTIKTLNGDINVDNQ